MTMSVNISDLALALLAASFLIVFLWPSAPTPVEEDPASDPVIGFQVQQDDDESDDEQIDVEPETNERRTR